tara:strand:- start:19790 stop:20362 length:573 start_codon:yes stop_codon:yes gene_type:complete
LIKILGGKHKGININTPYHFKTRPTNSRLRESVFNILLHSKHLSRNFSDIEVIDIFAGSGALGLEALSRGCKFCTFIDSSQDAIDAIEKNIIKLREEKNSTVIKANALKPIYNNKKYDLCFFDPPYDITNFSNIIEKWLCSKIMKQNTIYIYEKNKNNTFDLEKKLNIIGKKQQGISEIIIFKNLSSSPK